VSQWTARSDELEQRELARERRRLTALTLVAGLDAILLALVGAQFVFPPVFIALLCVAPVIIAIEALWTPAWVTLESGLVVTLVALALYGPVIGLWTLAYVIAGLVCGFGRRLRVPAPLRVIALTVTLLALVVATLGALFWLGGLSVERMWALIAPWLDPLTSGRAAPSAALASWLAVTATTLLALLLAVSIELFARAITRRLPLEALRPSAHSLTDTPTNMPTNTPTSASANAGASAERK
jgi:hypothetical protein